MLRGQAEAGHYDSGGNWTTYEVRPKPDTAYEFVRVSVSLSPASECERYTAIASGSIDAIRRGPTDSMTICASRTVARKLWASFHW
jgi:hypothetical protein